MSLPKGGHGVFPLQWRIQDKIQPTFFFFSGEKKPFPGAGGADASDADQHDDGESKIELD